MIALALSLLLMPASTNGASLQVVVPLSERGELDVGQFVNRLARAVRVELAAPDGRLLLPLTGLAGAFSRGVLTEALGTEASWTMKEGRVIVTLPADWNTPARLARLTERLKSLARRTEEAIQQAQPYGMHALPSYRPNAPERPTVCLVHGLNSNSHCFVHLIPRLEEAGYGIVVYDYPFNRDLDDSAAVFENDWRRFRAEKGDRQPWSIVGHSMGALLARAYAEGPSYSGDVTALILIAPPNQGAAMAQNQTLIQMIQSVQASRNGDAAALTHLSDGLGEAATDMLPGSAFLKTLNSRPRREGVPYHILAGDRGFLSVEARRSLEQRFQILERGGAVLGSLARLTARSLQAQLDELTDGTGDGCVAVSATRLSGVADHITIPANHVELIRGPLLYPEPGPVVCLPYLLRWLPSPHRGP